MRTHLAAEPEPRVRAQKGPAPKPAPAARAAADDHETRQRLLTVAERLFADRGFKKVTVREICRAARANVAAVNYHFGDKLGLYREVLQAAIDGMRGTNDAAREAGAIGACLSGAGSTVIAFADSMTAFSRIKAAFAAVAADQDLPGRSEIVMPRNQGARVVGRSG